MKVTSTIKSPKVPEYAATLRQRREDLKMRQDEVAKKMGITAMGLSHYEKGTRAPNVLRLDEWAQIVGMEVNITLEESQSPLNKEIL